MKFPYVVAFIACLVATYALEELNSQKRKLNQKDDYHKRLDSKWTAAELSGLH